MAKKILIVDDEPDLVAVVQMRLEANGYDVISAADGHEGLEKACKEAPDLIILDLMLPKFDGYKICRFLKCDDKYKKIPVIIFTARSQESEEKMGYDAGANYYLVKPFEPALLLNKIKELLVANPQ